MMPGWYYRLKENWYWLKCYLFHPHNVIKIRSLGPGWSDKVILIRESLFQLLVDFIDKETPFVHINWDSDPGHKEAANAFIVAYKWITVERPALVQQSEALLHEWCTTQEQYNKSIGITNWTEYINTPKIDKPLHLHYDIDKKIETTDTEVLNSIVNYRGYMWT